MGLKNMAPLFSFNYKMFFGSGSKLRQTKDGEDLASPIALTEFYMDTFMCNEFHLKSQLCM